MEGIKEELAEFEIRILEVKEENKTDRKSNNKKIEEIEKWELELIEKEIKKLIELEEIETRRIDKLGPYCSNSNFESKITYFFNKSQIVCVIS